MVDRDRLAMSRTKFAVDLEVVDRQVLEVGERRQSGAEIVEREAAAETLERRDELLRRARGWRWPRSR
ncbi:MAG: hypothetical protein MZW92_46440 [Comamonadaceae bacterium]|nr:hypothetical protein [Comamonadaceae bacterium]